MVESVTVHPSTNRSDRSPAPELLDEIVRRIVDAVRPQRIVLFGSAARGEMSAHSDLDLLVVAATADRTATARAIRRALAGIGVAKDVIVVTPEDVQRHKDNRGLVIYPALREGKSLYVA
jgi:predicted nucleotidyltransferase